MVLTRTDENELLTALYAGLFQDRPWQLFLTRLAARTEADMCRIFICPAGDGEWRQVDCIARRAPDADSFTPDAPPFDELRSGRVYADDELSIKSAGRARHIRVSGSDGGGDLALSILRQKGDFRAREASLLASLVPHLTIMLQSHMRLEAERRRASIASKTLAGFSVGWLLIDRRGRILDCDPGAARVLDTVTLARRAADGRLRLFYPEAEVLLEEVVAERHVAAEPRAAWLSIDPPVQMLVMRPPDGDRDGAGEATSLAPPHCLILLRRMMKEGVSNGRFLSRLFRLTRSEAALAARIAGGDSLAEAADALGLTIETARNYSKRIYVKVGVRGQAELVRIVLEGVRMPG